MQDNIPKPEAQPPVWDNIPPELADRPQWLLWRYELPEGKKKWQKIPYYVAGGRRTGDQGSERDRKRLAQLSVVRRAYERGDWDGVGLAFLPDDGLVGIDLDAAIDDDGVVNERHQAIVDSCPGTYVEISPSGRGCHIIARGKTHTAKSDPIGVEFYCNSQFFTVTGRLWPGTHPALGPVLPMVIDGLHAMIEKAKEEARAAKAAKQPSRPAADSPPRSASSGGDPFKRVNEEAMRHFDAWVPQLLPAAKPYKGGYRVSSKDLGRELQEDLAIHPNGIQDFGEERGFTPIDLVMQWLPAAKPSDALAWLASRLGIELGPRATKRAAAGSGSSPAAAAPESPPEDDIPFAEPDDRGGVGASTLTLLKGKGNKPEDCRENVLYCLRSDPELKGLVAHNLFTELQDKTRRPPWGGEPGEWTEEDDLMLGEYLARAHRLLIKGTGTLRAGVQMAARENKYHPIVQQLRSLEWDGKPRLDTWLIECLGAVDRPYARLVSRFFVMGMVARLLRPGCKFDYMLILQGDQGLGKSTAFRILADPYFMDTPFRIGDKDSYLSLQGVWLVEFSELEAMSKSESTAIKAFVTSVEDRFRPPYGSRMVKMPRRAVLAGTTNSDQFLKDATGERRFWPVQVTVVKQDLLREWRDQLLAEALYLLEKEEDAEKRRYHPTRAEEQEIFHPEQERWRMSDVWTDILGDYLRRTTNVDGEPLEDPPAQRAFFPSQELFQKALYIKAERMDNAKLMQQRIANSMRELGFHADREPTGGRKRGYMRPGWEFERNGRNNKVRKIAEPTPAGHSQPGEAHGLPI